MIKSSVEKLAYEIGFDIANSDDETQSKLLNGFAEGLVNAINGTRLETQLCYIAKGLDPKAEKLLTELVEFIKLKN